VNAEQSFLSEAQSRSNDRLHALDYLIEGQVGGVDHHSVWGGLQRRRGSCSVALVALANLPQNGFWGDRRDGGSGLNLLITALAPHRGVGVKKNLDVGVGKDGVANVAAFHHNPSAFAQFAL